MVVALPVVAGLLTVTGPLVGLYIGKLSASELKVGRVNVKVAAHILVTIATYLFATQYVSNPSVAALIAFAIGGLLSWHDVHHPKPLPSELLLVALGVMLALSISGPNFVTIASVTFVYAAVVGSLVHAEWKVATRYSFVVAGAFIATLLIF